MTTTQTDFPGIATAQMDEVESTLNNAQENAFAGTEEELLEGWKAALLAADYQGIMTGILHTRNDNVADAAVLVGNYDIVAAQVAEKAIPECNITFIAGNDMKAKLSSYLGILFEQNPAAVGGALPNDDFYYNAD